MMVCSMGCLVFFLYEVVNPIDWLTNNSIFSKSLATRTLDGEISIPNLLPIATLLLLLLLLPCASEVNS